MVVARTRPTLRPIALLLLVAVTFIVMDRASFGPTDWLRGQAQGIASSTSSFLTARWPSDSDEVRALQGENDALRAQLASAQGQLLSSQDQARQLAELQQLLALPSIQNAGRVVASVTATKLTNFDDAIEIGKGSDAGVRVGMPVMNGAGLVGRVVQTSPTTATVVLVTDSTVAVGVRFASTGDVAVSVGQGAGKPLRADLIDLDSKVAVGDIAFTNGQDGSQYPPGMPVARVTETVAGRQDLRRTVTMVPTADVAHLQTVMVVQWQAP